MAVIMTDEQFDELSRVVESINHRLSELTSLRILENSWLDSDQVCKLLGISKRTLQTYRSEGLIAFSQHGSKIWYSGKDIQDFINKGRIDSYK